MVLVMVVPEVVTVVSQYEVGTAGVGVALPGQLETSGPHEVTVMTWVVMMVWGPAGGAETAGLEELTGGTDATETGGWEAGVLAAGCEGWP